jgi:hypothetical protein
MRKPWLKIPQGAKFQKVFIKGLGNMGFMYFGWVFGVLKNFKIALAFGRPFDRFCVPFLQKGNGWFTANP